MSSDFDTFAQKYRHTHTASIAAVGVDSAYFASFKAGQSVIRCGFGKGFTGNILDFGCGDGLLIKSVKTLLPQAHCFGVDASVEMIVLAKESGPSSCEFSLLESNLNMYPDKYFDLVVVANVFHHIERRKWQLWLKELIRVTRDGGQIHFYEHNPLNPVMRYFVRICPFDVGVRLIFPIELEEALRQYSGLKFDLNYMLFFPRWSLVSKLVILEKYLSHFPFGGQYILAVKKSF
jgi:ubiquinone/menaquinone biosynthesis C-methylase UbiE